MNIKIMYDIESSMYKAYEYEMMMENNEFREARRLIASDYELKPVLEHIRWYGNGVKEIEVGAISNWRDQ